MKEMWMLTFTRDDVVRALLAAYAHSDLGVVPAGYQLSEVKAGSHTLHGGMALVWEKLEVEAADGPEPVGDGVDE